MNQIKLVVQKALPIDNKITLFLCGSEDMFEVLHRLGARFLSSTPKMQVCLRLGIYPMWAEAFNKKGELMGLLIYCPDHEAVEAKSFPMIDWEWKA